MTRWRLATTLAVGCLLSSAPPGRAIDRDLLDRELRDLRNLSDPESLRITIPYREMSQDQRNVFRDALAGKIRTMGEHPRLVLEHAKVRIYGLNYWEAEKELDGLLRKLEDTGDRTAPHDEALALWAQVVLKQSVDATDGQQAAARVAYRILSYIRTDVAASLSDESIRGDLRPAAIGFMNIHGERGRDLVMLLSRAAFLAHGKGETGLVLISHQCATAVVTMIRNDWWAWLVKGACEMSFADASMQLDGIQSLRNGAALMPGAETEPPKSFFLDPAAYFEAKDLSGSRPSNDADLARYRAHLVIAQLWYGDPFAGTYGFDTPGGRFIVAHGPIAFVEHDLGGYAWSADSVASIPVHEVNGVPAQESIGLDFPRRTTLISVTGDRKDLAQISDQMASGDLFRFERGPSGNEDRFDEMRAKVAQSVKENEATGYQDQAALRPQVFLAEYTSRNPGADAPPGSVRAELVLGFVPPASGKAPESWGDGRRFQVMEWEGGAAHTVWTGILTNGSRHRLPDGNTVYLADEEITSLGPGGHTMEIAVEPDPGVRPFVTEGDVFIEELPAGDLGVSDFRRMLPVDADTWVSSPVDRIVRGDFRFAVSIYGLTPGPRMLPSYRTRFAVFDRQVYADSVIPEVVRMKREGKPVRWDSFLSLALTHEALRRGEHFEATGVGALGVLPVPKSPETVKSPSSLPGGTARYPTVGQEDLTIDLKVGWLPVGEYVLVMEVSDELKPDRKAYQKVPFIVTTADRFLAPLE